jgi:hypothetical protein
MRFVRVGSVCLILNFQGCNIFIRSLFGSENCIGLLGILELLEFYSAVTTKSSNLINLLAVNQ